MRSEERRCKYFVVNPYEVLDFLTYRGDIREHVTYEIPENAEIRNVDYDARFGGFVVILFSPDFDIVPPCEMFPPLSVYVHSTKYVKQG